MADIKPLTIGYDSNNNASKLVEVNFSSINLDDFAGTQATQGQVLAFSGGVFAPSTIVAGGGTSFTCNDLSACDHGILAGLGDDDHTQYVLSDGTRPMSTLFVDGALRANTVSSLSISGVALNATTASALTLHVTNLGASTIVLTAVNAPTVAATTSVSSASVSAVSLNATNASALNLTATNLSVPGNIAVTGTVDGVDIASRDSVLTSTTTTANNALPKAGGVMTGTLDGTTLNATTSVSSASVSAVSLNATNASALNLTATNGTMTGSLDGTILNATTSVSSASVSAVALNATNASALNLTATNFTGTNSQIPSLTSTDITAATLVGADEGLAITANTVGATTSLSSASVTGTNGTFTNLTGTSLTSTDSTITNAAITNLNVSRVGPMNPTTYIQEADWLTPGAAANGFGSSQAGTGAGFGQCFDNDVMHPDKGTFGVYEIRSGTDTYGRAFLTTFNNAIAVSSCSLSFTSRIAPSGLWEDGVNDGRMCFGIRNGTSNAEATYAMEFQYGQGGGQGGTTWSAVVTDNSNSTVSDSGIVVSAQGFQVLQVSCNENWDRVDFYIDGTRTADFRLRDHNIPDSRYNRLGAGWAIRNANSWSTSNQTNGNEIFLDWHQLRMTHNNTTRGRDLVK